MRRVKSKAVVRLTLEQLWGDMLGQVVEFATGRGALMYSFQGQVIHWTQGEA